MRASAVHPVIDRLWQEPLAGETRYDRDEDPTHSPEEGATPYPAVSAARPSGKITGQATNECANAYPKDEPRGEYKSSAHDVSFAVSTQATSLSQISHPSISKLHFVRSPSHGQRVIGISKRFSLTWGQAAYYRCTRDATVQNCSQSKITTAV